MRKRETTNIRRDDLCSPRYRGRMIITGPRRREAGGLNLCALLVRRLYFSAKTERDDGRWFRNFSYNFHAAFFAVCVKKLWHEPTIQLTGFRNADSTSKLVYKKKHLLFQPR